MAAEQDVDFAAIRVGDKVKLRCKGLESTDWHEVTRLHTDELQVSGGWYVVQSQAYDIDPAGPEVIAHQPAPRKVEVTLGEPLTLIGRKYSDQVVAARNFGDDRLDVYLNTEGPTHLPPSEARRLARDLLATVGVDD